MHHPLTQRRHRRCPRPWAWHLDMTKRHKLGLLLIQRFVFITGYLVFHNSSHIFSHHNVISLSFVLPVVVVGRCRRRRRRRR